MLSLSSPLMLLLFLQLVRALSTNPRLQLAAPLSSLLDPATDHHRNGTSLIWVDHQKSVCYSEDQREIPVNVQNCLPVTRKMIRMRRSEQFRLFKGSDCPITITEYVNKSQSLLPLFSTVVLSQLVRHLFLQGNANSGIYSGDRVHYHSRKRDNER